jgi:acyl carrier protein
MCIAVAGRAVVHQDDDVSEVRLPGGFVSDVVRLGGTVRRTLSKNAGFVHELLDLFARRGWAGAPRFLGVDADGREMLEYLPGHVGWQSVQPAGVVSDESLAMVAQLVRQFHDLTAGSRLAGAEQVVCHNDLSPKNTVYRDLGRGLRPVALLDWDLAAPGPRIHDVAHVCWQYLDLGPSIADPADAVAGLRLLCDAYGLVDRGSLVETIAWWQDRCWRGIEAAAEADDPAGVRLRAAGAIEEVRTASAWVANHQPELESGIREHAPAARHQIEPPILQSGCNTAWQGRFDGSDGGGLADMDPGESDPQLPTIADDLVDLWKRVLRTDDITVDDDFFDVGGNSLSAIRLLPVIEQHFGVEPNISLVFDHPTPRQMAAALATIGAKARHPAG